ncbi:MAG: hypothetical protein J5J00_05500 [Deltaproteobacteria bacterium]|nr:hypothetical protein [Deltaproteobacteria bacterium]
MTRFVATFLFVFVFAGADRAAAEFYRYIDKSGREHFVDKISSVPDEYRSQVTAGEGLAQEAGQASVSLPFTDPIAWFKAETLGSSPDVKVAEWTSSQGSSVPVRQLEVSPQPKTSVDAKLGKTFLRFDGRNDYMTSDSIATAIRAAKAVTAVYVVRTDRDSPQFVWSVHAVDKFTDVIRAGFLNLSRGRLKAGEQPLDYLDSSTIQAGKLSVYTAIFEEDRSRLFFNGRQVLSKAPQKPVDFKKAATFTIGQEWDKGKPSDYFRGEMAELVIFGRALPEEERRSLEKELMERYSINIEED